MSPLKQRSQRKKIGFDIKNSDRNGPEGQFITASTTMCNAGSPLYNRVCLSSPVSIKVSMKKKRKEAVQEQGAWPKFYSCNQLVCARLQIPDLEVGRQRSGAVRSGACSSRQAWGPGSRPGWRRTRQAVWAAVKMPRILSHLSTADWLVRRAGPCQKFTNPNVWIARGVDNSSRAYTKPIRPRGPRQVRQQPTAAKMPTINVDKYALFEELGEQ